MMCRINPKVDLAFKKLFGSEENKDLLISFINSILIDEQIEDITIKNPYNVSNYINGKMSILDIKAVDEKGKWYDIEIQVAPQSFYDKRALYYWAKVYTDQLLEKGRYGALNKTIGINILDFDYLEGKEYHNMYKLLNLRTGKEFSDLLELHFIELKKFDKELKDLKTGLDRWVTFLNHAYEYSKNKIPKELEQDSSIKKAIEVLDVMYLDEDERSLYENNLKAFIDKQEELDTARQEGEYIKAIEIAKNLLDVLDIDTISIKTGLTKEEILKLKN
ncbi:Rpn family recombination-promoting nuclease/putative transposase [Inediibacterium massiliense]|uniref:Rpn family recombination-promoting nuclease/putative transposase n=1 Tax=Inediibacterium massiliense TaxID=1658111 RepID=UPI000A49CA91|nr:Rpn family recombination-promoting nuclease/putative transposase [Inediibacterium massiliense]